MSALIFRPEISPNSCRIPSTVSRLLLSSTITVRSSAYAESFTSLVPVSYPLTSGSSLIALISGSIAMIKRYGDMGSPCLQLRPISNQLHVCPFTITVALMFVIKVSTHLHIDSPNPNA